MRWKERGEVINGEFQGEKSKGEGGGERGAGGGRGGWGFGGGGTGGGKSVKSGKVRRVVPEHFPFRFF